MSAATRRSRVGDWLGASSRGVLPVVSARPAVSKVSDRGAAEQAVRAYRLLPEGLVPLVGFDLPFVRAVDRTTPGHRRTVGSPLRERIARAAGETVADPERGFPAQLTLDQILGEPAAFAARYPVQQAGGRTILELWVPAEEVDEFNRHIVGRIEVVREFRPQPHMEPSL